MPGRSGKDRIARCRAVAGHEGTDRGTRLRQDRQRRSHVPQIDVQFDIGVRAAGRDVGKTERPRAIEPWHSTGGDDAVGKPDEGFTWSTVRPAKLDGGASEVRGFCGANWCAIQRSAGATACGEGLAECGSDNDADHRGLAVEATKRDAETLAAAHEICGAIDRIDHPAQGSRAGSATFLALKAVSRIGLRQAFG